MQTQESAARGQKIHDVQRIKGMTIHFCASTHLPQENRRISRWAWLKHWRKATDRHSHTSNANKIFTFAFIHVLLWHQKNAVAFIWPHKLEGRLWQHKRKLPRLPKKNMLTKRNHDQGIATWSQLIAMEKKTSTVISMVISMVTTALTWRDLHSTVRKCYKSNINKFSFGPWHLLHWAAKLMLKKDISRRLWGPTGVKRKTSVNTAAQKYKIQNIN